MHLVLNLRLLHFPSPCQDGAVPSPVTACLSERRERDLMLRAVKSHQKPKGHTPGPGSQAAALANDCGDRAGPRQARPQARWHDASVHACPGSASGCFHLRLDPVSPRVRNARQPAAGSPDGPCFASEVKGTPTPHVTTDH